MADRFCTDVYTAAMTNEQVDVLDDKVGFDDSQADADGGRWFLFTECRDDDACEICDVLQEMGVAYDMHIEGKYEYSPEARWWRPGMEASNSLFTNPEFAPVVVVSDLKGKTFEEIQDLIKSHTIPPLTSG